MKLIVGLGNPGKEYENTRHNVGFIVIDNYTSNLIWFSEKNYMITSSIINGEKILFLKPLTYMNLSGDAVSKVANYYKISPEDILVIHDDLDLSIGIHRLKVNSSSGGHNGIKSIIEKLGTNRFARLKIGISHSTNGDTKDYVLGNFSKDDLEVMTESIKETKNIIDCYLLNGIERTMNRYNTK